jgi:hypothetical protein
MGESEGQGRNGKPRHNAEETNNVRQRPQEDCCGTTGSVGESESRKEDRLTEKLT